MNILHTPVANAHEVYVLTPEEFSNAWSSGGGLPMAGFEPPLMLAGTISLILAVFVLIYIEKRWGRLSESYLEKGSSWGFRAMQLSAGLVLLASAVTGRFLGTEMAMPYATFGLLLSIAAGISLSLNLLPKGGALLGTLLLALSIPENGANLFNYFYYLGIFGAVWLGTKKYPLLPALVRVTYGFSLLYAAIVTKFLHPAVTLAVVQKYGLTDYFLFPSDPNLIVVGAAVVETFIALCIILGFGLRPVLLVSMAVASLALIYLPEAPWPHLAMYGVSAYLFLSPQRHSLDNMLRSKKPA